MTALVSTSFATFALYSFRLMARFLDGCCDDFLLSDSENGIFLPTNAPALKGIDAIVFGRDVVMVPPRLALQCATLTTFSLFLIATSTSLGHELFFDAGVGSPAMSGRKTHVPTRIPRTSWITSSGFMLAKLMAGSGWKVLR